MKLIRLGAACLNQTPLHWDSNLRNILAAIDAARQAQVSILCLPELCISGYGCEDAFLGAGVAARALHVLFDIVPHTHGLIVAVGLPLAHQNRMYNAVALLVDGDIGGFTIKRFLAGDGIHYEPRWFHPWPPGVRDHIELRARNYPLGDVDFDCGGVQIGFEICEEAWVADRPGIRLAQRGVDVILNPSASHFAFNKFGVRQRFVLEGSRAFSAAYVYANLVGNEAGRVIYDGGCLIASGGTMLALGSRFSFHAWELISGVADLDLTRMKQARTSAFQPNPQSCVRVAFTFPELFPQNENKPTLPHWEQSATLKEEEFTRAVALGLYDYMRKSRAQGFVLSLSGGADSAAVACLVRYMVALGVQQLGLAELCTRLGLSVHTDVKDLMRILLACVYQASAHSSDTTRNAAHAIATALHASYYEWNIEHLVTHYRDIVASVVQRPLDWTQDDLALQNIQARSRAPGVWLLANVRNALLLATSNRSEVAVGYATMDGDTCGGLSPLAGISKHFIRTWLVWLEQQGAWGLFPIPALSAVNQQQPTAELRPGAAQTDEADLMPYDLLNAIETAAIRDRDTPWEIFCLMQRDFPHYSAAQLLIWIERFFNLWSRTQWKRERYAPSFHVDDINLDPRSGCRFPILSGGFYHELQEMRAKAQDNKQD
jgi:NAD+ synthase (glutamine-hydrolysing)